MSTLERRFQLLSFLREVMLLIQFIIPALTFMTFVQTLK